MSPTALNSVLTKLVRNTIWETQMRAQRKVSRNKIKIALGNFSRMTDPNLDWENTLIKEKAEIILLN